MVAMYHMNVARNFSVARVTIFVDSVAARWNHNKKMLNN